MKKVENLPSKEELMRRRKAQSLNERGDWERGENEGTMEFSRNLAQPKLKIKMNTCRASAYTEIFLSPLNMVMCSQPDWPKKKKKETK